MNDYEIGIKHEDKVPTINFANNTAEFIEVVITVDGRDIRTGEKYDGSQRGYCYPDMYERNIKKMAVNINLKSYQQIKAYIFKGKGKHKEIDFDLPPFIRRKIGEQYLPSNRKALFKRFSDTPSFVLNY